MLLKMDMHKALDFSYNWLKSRAPESDYSQSYAIAHEVIRKTGIYTAITPKLLTHNKYNIALEYACPITSLC